MSNFSKFIRTSTTEEKEAVYKEVMNEMEASQQEIIKADKLLLKEKAQLKAENEKFRAALIKIEAIDRNLPHRHPSIDLAIQIANRALR